MSKFKIPRRLAAIENLNIRGQNHGKTKIKAVDLKVTFTGDLELLDLLIPSPDDKDNKTSEFFFTEDGHLRVPTVAPLSLLREPEGLQVSLFDRKDPAILTNAKMKGFVIELQEGGSISVSCTIQGIPEKGYTERFKDILFSSIEMVIESDQEDLFSMPGAEDDEGKAQKELLPDASRGRNGKGRNEGLRNSEVKVKDEEEEDGKGKGDPVGRLTQDVDAANGGKKAKKAVKKKSRGKRQGA